MSGTTHDSTPARASRPATASTRSAGTALEAALNERILVIDGAMGTMIQAADLTAEDFGGDALEGCNENLVLTRPDVIRRIHEAYLEAGADIVETNTFGATSIVLAEYGLEAKAREINRRAAEIAREAVARFATPGRPRFVAGAMGPTTKALSVTGGATFDELRASYREQALGLLEGGIDAFLVETCQDTLNLKAAILGIRDAERESGRSAPLMVSVTIEPTGTMLAGQTVDALWASIAHFEPLSVGLNCATGPEFMTDHLRTLSELATTRVSVYPNAGLPDEDGHYEETPQSLALKLKRFLDAGWLNVVGGCCGTTPDHIREVAKLVEGRAPRAIPSARRRFVSGIEYLEVDDANRPVLVGERTNVIGSRRFKRLIGEGLFEEASEVGRAQVRKSAQVVDVCLADPDRDEYEDMATFLPHLVRKVKVPVMIDSTDARVIELALKHLQGKGIVNSVNLEDGEERFEAVIPLVREYGAAVVVGTIDEDPENGMAVTAERKLEVARRSYDLLTKKYGLPAEDILFDPLVFPVGTGDEKYTTSARETIEGVRLVSREFPECSTILGISNVSFGLPPAGREVLNAVFLYHCTKAGLTYAIVNTEVLERYASISDHERKLAEDLLFCRADDALAAFAAHFRDVLREHETSPRASLPLDERLARCIVEGTKEGLADDLDLALAEGRDPLAVINGPLMRGMDEVGRLFNANELIVAEVLQSAESMKAAVDHLKPHLERAMREDGSAAGDGSGRESSRKGRIVLATVKGDVHDIGKNLVEIILSNNGYDVVNLGIKVTPEALVKACREHAPDAIGLSGLLVKSAQQMVVTAEDLRSAGIGIPLLVGGAALSKRFTGTRIAPAYEAPVLYAKDAMQGLDLLNGLQGDEAARTALVARVQAEQATMRDASAAPAAPRPAAFEAKPLDHSFPLPRAPDYARHVLRDVDVRTLFPYVNPLMLFSKHLGLKGDVEKLVAKGDEKAIRLKAVVDDLMAEAHRDNLIRPRAVFRFFPAQSDGNDLVLYDPDAPGAREIERFRFRRQKQGPGRCLSDFTRPAPVDGAAAPDELDSVAFFVTTAGEGVRERAEELKAKGEYLKCHALQALAIETAEAFAERVHSRIRTLWGFPDPPELTSRDLFKKKYRGVRVSFGYPACPDLEDQEKLFRLLGPEEIGVNLTEGFMMDPEASVSALVFHHPDGDYFNV